MGLVDDLRSSIRRNILCSSENQFDDALSHVCGPVRFICRSQGKSCRPWLQRTLWKEWNCLNSEFHGYPRPTPTRHQKHMFATKTKLCII
eukprot:3204626-Amphidinium_carterae.1